MTWCLLRPQREGWLAVQQGPNGAPGTAKKCRAVLRDCRYSGDGEPAVEAVGGSGKTVGCGRVVAVALGCPTRRQVLRWRGGRPNCAPQLGRWWQAVAIGRGWKDLVEITG